MGKLKDAVMDLQVNMEMDLGREVEFEEAQDELARRMREKQLASGRNLKIRFLGSNKDVRVRSEGIDREFGASKPLRAMVLLEDTDSHKAGARLLAQDDEFIILEAS